MLTGEAKYHDVRNHLHQTPPEAEWPALNKGYAIAINLLGDLRVGEDARYPFSGTVITYSCLLYLPRAG